MAIGLDTSVVLRLLIGEPRAHAEVARRRLERALIGGEQVIVTDLVVAEAFHALRHHYDVPPAVALGRLRDFFSAGGSRWIQSGPWTCWGKSREGIRALSTA